MTSSCRGFQGTRMCFCTRMILRGLPAPTVAVCHTRSGARDSLRRAFTTSSDATIAGDGFDWSRGKMDQLYVEDERPPLGEDDINKAIFIGARQGRAGCY